MADQVPTIASFPAGYATLAGCLYAVFTTDRSNWDLVVWKRVSRIFERRALWWRGRWTAEEGFGFERGERGSATQTPQEKLVTALSKCVTKHARHFSGPCAICRNSAADAGNEMEHLRLAEWTAALSVVLKAGQIRRQSRTRDPGRTEDRALGTTDTTDIIELHSQNPNPSTSQEPEEITESPTAKVSTVLPIITVEILGETKIIEKHRIAYNAEWMSTILNHRALQGCSERNAIWRELLTHSEPPQSHQISVQIAGSIEIFMVDLAYKLLEIFFGGAIVLGSTGGAWLGLTLGSLFPTRRAAGIFTSAYGQVDNSDVRWPRFRTRHFIAAGTVWATDFEIAPRGLTDDVRIALGYLFIYIYLTLIQLFKPDLRKVLDFGNYYQTKDVIRWVLLFFQVLVVIFLAKEIIHGYKMKKLKLFYLFIALASYVGCNVIVFLAQKWWGPFHLLSKVVDPVAVVGCLATGAMRRVPEERLGMLRGSSFSSIRRHHLEIDVESGNSSLPEHGTEISSRFSAETWILIWAIGACTAVY